MGVPHLEGENTLPSPTDDVDSGQDGQELSDNGQSVCDQVHTSTEDHSDIPKISPDEDAEKLNPPDEDSRKPISPDEGSENLTPRPKRNTERVPENQTSGSIGGGGGGGALSVTLLTLDANLELRPHSRNFLPSPRNDRETEMSDLKLIRDFQVRRKYGRRPGRVRPAKQDKNFIDLGLSGTRYFTNGDTSSPDSARTRKTSLLAEESGRLVNSSTPASITITAKARTDEDGSSINSYAKDLQSPVPSFPPLSSGGPRSGVRSENSFYSSRHSGQSPSLLVNHFGFRTIRPDTFSGMQKHRKLKLAAAGGNDELLKELEHHAQKQILACQNMGFTHRGSRAAESVLSLKHTVSPSAFHSSSYTRHVPREERGSRSETPAGVGEGEERPRRRVTPAGKLSMSRLVVQDRQEKTARRTTLPTVSGNSLQVMLTGSHSK